MKDEAKKVCPCCARVYTLPQFEELPLVGWVGDPEERCEMRNCPCKSTIAIVRHADGRVEL